MAALKTNNWFTKKKLFLIELGAIVIAFVVATANQYNYISCMYTNPTSGHTTYYCDSIFGFLIPVVAALPFSIILYFLRDEVFRAWLSFSIRWTPTVMLLSIITPTSVGQGIGPSSSPVYTAVIFSGLYLLVSTGVIIGNVAKYNLNDKHKHLDPLFTSPVAILVMIVVAFVVMTMLASIF